MKRLKLLFLVKPFGSKYPKHKAKYDFLRAIEEFAEVKYWNNDGDIREILKKLNYSPDFIFHYDVGWNFTYAPKIKGLEKLTIPVGSYVIDVHSPKEQRLRYFKESKVDLIFSVTKHPFLKAFPQYKSKFRFLPFSINPDVIKNWKEPKDIDFLLMGLISSRQRYPLREAVLKKMSGMAGFVHIPHPGHFAAPRKDLIVNENYARTLNRSKIFFTCGGLLKYPVMKFFEAPGCGTLLFAEPNPDITELGFKDGVNYVACHPSNFYEKALYYLENEDERERISKNGYDFIHAHHTNRVRAKEFIRYVEDYLQKSPKKRASAAPRRSPQKSRANASHWIAGGARNTGNKGDSHVFIVNRNHHGKK
ncbi:glycosyltransferase [Ammoniphilus sp. YIM 78166]|uniref:glycosyltransferase family protein n=1 Tax=Ammoniphilus sp. YIM 78166 TaxID=1644106 RepID=UPI00106F0B6A|nr:glycosyltransferase [Ammoniphilus sp. YIM 78166]